MFIAIKNSKILSIHEVEWECRRKAKKINDLTEYWTWLESVTTDGVPDYSGEDYEIVETDAPLSYQDKDKDGNDITVTFNESGHIHSEVGTGKHYHLKWDGTKIVKDDTAKAAWELAEEWKRIRTERTRLLADTDWVVIKARENGGTVPAKWKTYRVALRDLPAEQSDKTKYSDITWPTQPS